MTLIKHEGRGFDKFIGKVSELKKDEVEIGWFVQQGLHHSNLSYPDLARVHFNGVKVPKRDILGIALFLHNPKNDRKLKRSLKDWIKNLDSRDSKDLFDVLGKLQTENIKKSFGNNLLGVTTNPNPLIETSDWKNNTAYKIRSDGGIKK